MSTQMINRSLGPMDDLLLTLAGASARSVSMVETLRQRTERQCRTMKENDALVGLRLLSKNVDWLEALQPANQAVQSSIADQLVNSGDFAALERTTTLLREQVELMAQLSKELVKERQQRRTAESTTADLQRQLAELEQNLCVAMSGSASEDDGTARTVQETHRLVEMEEKAKDWRRRSRKKPRNARRLLRKGVKKFLGLLVIILHRGGL